MAEGTLRKDRQGWSTAWPFAVRQVPKAPMASGGGYTDRVRVGYASRRVEKVRPARSCHPAPGTRRHREFAGGPRPDRRRVAAGGGTSPPRRVAGAGGAGGGRAPGGG